VLYLYGLIEDRPVPMVAGICGAPITTSVCGDLAAVVSEHEELDLAPTEPKLWEHESVLEKLMEQGPVLPVRFGVTFANTEAVRRELEPRHEGLAAALERVRGRVEVSVRVLEHSASLPVPRRNGASSLGPGQRYLRARLERRRGAIEIAERIRQELLPLVVEERPGTPMAPGTLLASSYLIDASQLEAFRARAEVLQSRSGGAVVCTGPWPPYNFTEVDGS